VAVAGLGLYYWQRGRALAGTGTALPDLPDVKGKIGIPLTTAPARIQPDIQIPPPTGAAAQARAAPVLRPVPFAAPVLRPVPYEATPTAQAVASVLPELTPAPEPAPTKTVMPATTADQRTGVVVIDYTTIEAQPSATGYPKTMQPKAVFYPR
jgi:hypothetical protein